MNYNKIVSFILCITLTAFVISCRKKSAEWKGTIEEIDGVVVVNNADMPIYEGNVFQLEEELTIEESDADQYIFSEIVGITVDDAGNVFVLDFKEANIKVFNEVGEYIRTISKKGEGPGELSMPASIGVTPRKELMVHDMMNRRLTFFSFDGDFTRQISIAKVNVFSCCLDLNDNIIGMVWEGEDTDSAYSVKKLDQNCTVLKTFVSSPSLNQLVFRPPLPIPVLTFSAEGYAVFSYPEEYTFQVFNTDGNEIKRIHKEHKPVPVSKEELDTIKERTKRLPDSVKVEISSHYPAFRGISLDEEGRFFVNTYENKEGTILPTYEVFDSEGRYIAKIEINSTPMLWKRGKLYTIEEDEEGFKVVKRYKVTWNY